MPQAFDEQEWNAALTKRGEEAERRHQAGVKLTGEDITVMALLHPDKFDIQVKLKEG